MWPLKPSVAAPASALRIDERLPVPGSQGPAAEVAIATAGSTAGDLKSFVALAADKVRQLVVGKADSKSTIEAFFREADIQIGGTRPWDVTVNDESFYTRLLSDPALQLGETYMDGLWDTPNIAAFFEKLLVSGVAQKAEHDLRFIARNLMARAANMQTKQRSLIVGREHYDVGNELYKRMLDPSMMYTCALYTNPAAPTETLEQAQLRKLDLICQKLDLQPGDRVLDIGCGWGGFAKHAAERYGVSVVGITISEEQLKLGRERCSHLPQVDLRFMDYRDLGKEKFDKVVSIEMIEAVGPKNLREYMEAVHRALKPGGRFLLQCFGANKSVQVCNSWFDKYIFPNGHSPSLKQLSEASEKLFGGIADLHNIRTSYATTLHAWWENFNARFDEINAATAKPYDERFRRMWNFYLQSLEASFKVGHLQLYQILYTKGPVDYGSVPHTPR